MMSSIQKTKIIDFYPQDRYFVLEFVLPTYEEVSKNLYAWKIEGISHDWTFQKDNTLQLSMLPYGNHRLINHQR